VSIRSLVFLLLCCAPLSGQERQHHGVVFEKWVRDTFFDGYTPAGYTQKWDIPAAANVRHGRIPVNPKAAKYRGPVDFGDALRQFAIDEPFLLVVGYWEDTPGGRRMAAIHPIVIEPAAWRALWGGITRADLEMLDAVIKDRSLTPEEARRRAQEIKGRPPFTGAVMTINPKIDSKTQRRLQCSLGFAAVSRLLGRGVPLRQDPPALWGVTWPGF
jgi:hypothetical protein